MRFLNHTSARRRIPVRGLGLGRLIDRALHSPATCPFALSLSSRRLLSSLLLLHASLSIQSHHDVELQPQLQIALSLTRRLYVFGPTFLVFLCALLSFSASASPRLDT